MSATSSLNASFTPRRGEKGVNRVDVMNALNVMKAVCIDVLDKDGNKIDVVEVRFVGGTAKIVVDSRPSVA